MYHSFAFALILVLSAVPLAVRSEIELRVSYPSQLEKELLPSMNDYAEFVGKVKGKAVAKEADGRAGLLLQLSDRGVNNSNPYESFEIEGTEHTIIIRSYTYKGLELGIYTLLDEWGFRWYLPGIEHLPQKVVLQYKGKKVYTPSFSYRNMFAQTGAPRCVAIDKSSALEQRVEDWERRNRMLPLAKMPGHHWDQFKRTYHAELQKHPEWAAEVNGKRTAFKSGVKFCISNSEFREFYIKERVQEAKRIMKANPNNRLWIVSVEPSDRGGYCTCNKCNAFGSVSTSVFFLANEVAKAVKSLSPNLFVCLYAYGGHADVPQLEIESNVLVQLSPYKFQNVAKPLELIKKWSAKVPGRLSIRDYYYPVMYNVDKPLQEGSDHRALYERLQIWKGHGIYGGNIESSYGFGALGLCWWVFARYSFDNTLSLEQIEADYYKQFGTDEQNARAIHKILSQPIDTSEKKPLVTNQQLKELFTKASMLKQSRATDMLKLYLLYCHYFKSFRGVPNKLKPEKLKALDQMMEFVWRQYWYCAVHSSGIAASYAAAKQAKAFIAEHVNTKWNPKDKRSNDHLAALPLFTTESLQKEFEAVKKQYK